MTPGRGHHRGAGNRATNRRGPSERVSDGGRDRWSASWREAGTDDSPAASPRDRFLTVYGRNPVLEALADDRLQPVRLLVAEGSRGEAISRIERRAAKRGVRAERLPAHRVSLLSGNGRQDQGVMLDVATPALGPLREWLAAGHRGPALLLDGLTNPANVGMIIRSAVAAGCAVIVPRRGVAELGPLVVKASAGVLFTATVLRCPSARDAAEDLVEAGCTLVGLRGAPTTPSLWEQPWPDQPVLVVGGESQGISPGVADLTAAWRRIPMAGGVESLNAAVAASIACFELRRAGPGRAP